MYALLRGFMRLVVRVYLAGRFRLTGAATFPRRGGVLVCPNHIGTIDPPLVPAFIPRGDTWSMAKSEWFHPPGFKSWLFRTYHAFPVIRHSADRGALKRAFEILAGGQALIVYAEGTRVESGGLQRAEPGIGFIARVSGSPVVPVALSGTRECLPRGAHWPRRVPVEMALGRPFRVPERLPDGRRVDNQDAADAVMLAIAEMLPPPLRGAYSDIDELAARVGHLRVYEPAS